MSLNRRAMCRWPLLAPSWHLSISGAGHEDAVKLSSTAAPVGCGLSDPLELNHWSGRYRGISSETILAGHLPYAPTFRLIALILHTGMFLARTLQEWKLTDMIS